MEPRLRVFVARAVAPSLKTTVPLGVPLPGEVAVTVAVKTTDWPETEGLAEEARAVELLALLTVCVSAEDVLVSTEPVRGLSARNVYEGVVRGIERGAADAALRCLVHPELPEWVARLTPAAVAELGVVPGSAVWLAVKSHSVQVVSTGTGRPGAARV